MAAYYYTLSALPQLGLDSERLPEMDEFLSFCALTIPAGDYRRLIELPTDTWLGLSSEQALLREYSRFDVGLRNEIVRQRAAKLHKSYEQHAHVLPSLEDFTAQADVSDIAREVVSAESPLEGDRLLTRARFRKLEELCGGHFFDFTMLLAYRLKLQLLLRKNSLSADAGHDAFEDNYTQLSEQVHQHVKDLGV